jgi:dTDP-4-amino-4,6-dideoxygalactose transaminase
MASQRLPFPMPVLPVLRPRLPSAAAILPYLEAIDKRRWYSNHGPLVTQLEERLGSHFGFVDGGVVSTANATLGLAATLLARNVRAESFCLMPSWTFAATPHAARIAGMKPYFHDVDRQTWTLNPDEVVDTVKRTLWPIGAVIVVSPFGAPIDFEAWESFEDKAGIPTIVDAAAGFDSTQAARVPYVVSMHATKMLGAGEGGFVATTDPQLVERVRASCNFGFHDSRSAMLPAMNAKMSEYHAAVGLASLGIWPETRSRQLQIAEWYRQGIDRVEGVTLQPGYGKGWATSTTSVLLPAGSAAEISRVLEKSGIETRMWWGRGCHSQPAFAHCPRGPLPVTEDLGTRVLGLPHFPEMHKVDVERVVDALKHALPRRGLMLTSVV